MAQIRKNWMFWSKLMVIAALPLFFGCQQSKGESREEIMNISPPNPDEKQSILLALLLDTSNSMDGLIDQAKSQLWKIVNELATAKCTDGKRPDIKIALYEYGNDGLSSGDGYIRMVSPFTTDLDVISEKLFALRTNGGSEFCGQVISKSLTQLEWGGTSSDLKMIFIAGNEPFDQGEMPYGTACSRAKEKSVVVNTIFCGDFNEGVNTHWKKGADITGGTYMSIDQNKKTVYIPTPYDEKISTLNEKLNDTYIYYGRQGADKKALQSAQDQNADRYGQSNKVERAVSKSSHAYKNDSWDLVDAAKENETVVGATDEAYLPQEMKGMTEAEKVAYVKNKSAQREEIQKQIQSLSKKRAEYIDTHTPKEQDDMLDATMIKAIKEKGSEKKLNFDKK